MIYDDARGIIRELVTLERPFFNPVGLLVVGCSSSEIAGGVIGHASTYELGEQVARAALDCGRELEFSCAFQCCEHLNRALVIERAEAEKRGLQIVCAVPRPKAGGSLATAAYKAMNDPVLVETIAADAAMTSVPFSVCLVRANSAEEAEQLAADIEANADPRKWICVEAESKIVDYSGDVVILIMTGADSAEAIHAAFTALAE